MLSSNSAEVGDLRHCLVSGIKMLDALHDQTRANVCASLNRATGAAGRPPVVAYPFDKQTHGRRAILMIGGTTFVGQRWPAQRLPEGNLSCVSATLYRSNRL